MKTLIASLLLLAGLFGAGQASATIDVYTFDSDAQEQTFRELTKELRCPKCQNQDIADSNAGLAKDLRDKTYQMVREGKEKQEVVDYMVARYGNFILYDPPLDPDPLAWPPAGHRHRRHHGRGAQPPCPGGDKTNG